VAPHAETGRGGGVTVCSGETVLWRAVHLQPFFAAEQAVEPPMLQYAHAVADVVAGAVGRIDQRLVPIGEEQSRQRMRFMMIDEA